MKKERVSILIRRHLERLVHARHATCKPLGGDEFCLIRIPPQEFCQGCQIDIMANSTNDIPSKMAFEGYGILAQKLVTSIFRSRSCSSHPCCQLIMLKLPCLIS